MLFQTRQVDERRFAEILNQNIRPARPIDSPELLQGRQQKLKEIIPAAMAFDSEGFREGS